MDTLEYIRLAHQPPEGEPVDTVRFQLVTNFTDDVCRRLLVGYCRAHGIAAQVDAVPYKQYHQALKGVGPALDPTADITSFWFDVSPYLRNEFSSDASHLGEVLTDLAAYANTVTGKLVVTTFATPSWGAFGNLYAESVLARAVADANATLRAMSTQYTHLHLLDIDRLLRQFGERQARDLRNLYAYDVPFSHDFLLEVVREWYAYFAALRGRTRKCLVLDLDNTLWGGVVGELGPQGIALGPGYPGYAFQNFQHAIRSYYDRGVILALNSRNNEADVDEVFAQNPHMLLTKQQFASMQINWQSKADNLVAIAKELNIGLDSLVFIDDDPVNRDHVRKTLPMVTVPDLPEAPEEYVRVLYDLRDFHQLALTEEDREKGRMYAEERARTDAKRSAVSLEDYVRGLGIVIDVALNDRTLIPRLSQLSLKTNQCNLTTVRYAEADLSRTIDSGGLVVSGTVQDKFGSYGTVLEAVVTRPSQTVAHLDAFLMSCRVMGRNIEYAFLDEVVRILHELGTTTVHALFIPTQKNVPSAPFLARAGFTSAPGERSDGGTAYVLECASYLGGAESAAIAAAGMLVSRITRNS